MVQTNSLSSANQEYWDTKAAVINSPASPVWIQELVHAVSRELLSRRTWYGLPQAVKAGGTKGAVRVLDYACGGGLASRTLYPYADQFIGIDVSTKMTEEYNASVAPLGATNRDMHATQGDIMTESSSIQSPDFFGFDLIVMSMALHHVNDPKLAIHRLVKRLAPGGSLVLIDWDPKGCVLFPAKHTHSRPNDAQSQHPGHGHGVYDAHGGKPSDAAHTISHDGFGKVEIEAWLKEAGCMEAEWVEFENKVTSGTPFMARGKRAS